MLPTVRDSLKLLSLEVLLLLRLKFSFIKDKTARGMNKIYVQNVNTLLREIKRCYNYCVRDCVGIRLYCWDLSRLVKVM